MKHRDKIRTPYNQRTWLNPPGHPSTGSVVCYHGDSPWAKHKQCYTYLELSDCQNSVRLHRTDFDSVSAFASKLKLLESEIRTFRKHLQRISNL